MSLCLLTCFSQLKLDNAALQRKELTHATEFTQGCLYIDYFLKDAEIVQYFGETVFKKANVKPKQEANYYVLQYYKGKKDQHGMLRFQSSDSQGHIPVMLGLQAVKVSFQNAELFLQVTFPNGEQYEQYFQIRAGAS